MKENKFSYKELIEKIRNKEYTKVVFLLGAGISTSSGIPDFRSPEVGVYSTLEKYHLSYPEQIFEIKYFTQNPLPFYEVHSKMISIESHFTSAHYFIAEFAKQEQLSFVFSQNIDGLEIQAGLPEDKLCQVHGNLRAARCQKCGFKHDINKLNEFIIKGVVYKCENCKRGLVRPNVVFFGEQLDKGYAKNIYKIAQADCVFIMGTSMKVAPFNLITEKISKNTPVVVVNKDMVYLNSDKYIHMTNDIDDNVEQIMRDLSWNFPQIKRTYPSGWNILSKQESMLSKSQNNDLIDHSNFHHEELNDQQQESQRDDLQDKISNINNTINNDYIEANNQVADSKLSELESSLQKLSLDSTQQP